MEWGGVLVPWRVGLLRWYKARSWRSRCCSFQWLLHCVVLKDVRNGGSVLQATKRSKTCIIRREDQCCRMDQRQIKPAWIAQHIPRIFQYPCASSGILQREVCHGWSIEALFIYILCPKIGDLLWDNSQGFAQVTCGLPSCRYAIFVTNYSNWRTVIAAILVQPSHILVLIMIMIFNGKK